MTPEIFIIENLIEKQIDGLNQLCKFDRDVKVAFEDAMVHVALKYYLEYDKIDIVIKDLVAAQMKALESIYELELYVSMVFYETLLSIIRKYCTDPDRHNPKISGFLMP